MQRVGADDEVMEPFLVQFDHDDIPDLPVFAGSESEVADLARSEIVAEVGHGVPVDFVVRPGTFVTCKVSVTVALDSPSAADEIIRDKVPSTFGSDQMRIGAGEIVCDAEDRGPGSYVVSVPVDVVAGESEHPEVRVGDARSIIELHCN